jgi:hypothetical protein
MIVEEALRRMAKRMMMLPTRNCHEKELKTLKRLYKSRALFRRYGDKDAAI